MKAGLGSYAIAMPNGLVVAAIVAVNAVGDIIDPDTGQGRRRRAQSRRHASPTPGSCCAPARRRRAPRPGENTTIGLVATNARLTKAEAHRMALMADDGFARAIFPSHTMGDGDTVFSLATGRWTGEANITQIGALAADVMARAIVRGGHRGHRAAEPAGGARPGRSASRRPSPMQLALLLLYAVGLTAFGVWVGRRVRGSGDFFVAGRPLSAPLLFSTVLAANIGAGTTVGATGQAYIDGVSGWWWNGAAGLGLDRAGAVDRPAHLARGRDARLPHRRRLPRASLRRRWCAACSRRSSGSARWPSSPAS